MKKSWIVSLVAMLAAMTATAQVEKQVEVTKAYVPSLEQATKLKIEPDMTDTMTLRPEIDYTITPLTLQTTLATRPIRPVTVTYWEFNRPRPFYLKAGVGMPMQSEVDFYASTQNPGTGYALGYLHHVGRYGQIENEFGYNNRAIRMINEVGAAAGKYLGRRIVEGDLSYRNRQDCRYGMYYPKSVTLPGDQIGYSDVNLNLRIGDDFVDLSRFNFDVALEGAMFFDHSDPIEVEETGNQLTLGARARLARAWRHHNVWFEAGYRYLAGSKALADVREQQLYAGLRYSVENPRMKMALGLDFYHDYVQNPLSFSAVENEAGNYLLPKASLEFRRNRPIHYFVELDSHLESNDFRSLSERNPYLMTTMWGVAPTVEYELMAGLKGAFGRDRFAYSVYAAVEYELNHRFWAIPALHASLAEHYYAGWSAFVQDELASFGVGATLTYRPMSSLLFEAAARFRVFGGDGTKVDHMTLDEPQVTGHFAARYEHRKFRIGVRAVAESERRWAILASTSPLVVAGTMEAPFAVDLRLDFEWILSSSMSLYLEGRNLANQPLYRFAGYREYGINGLVGVRMNF